MLTERGMAMEVMRHLGNRGHEAFLVGGAVRDELLGREPNDFDVATSAKPHEILAAFPHAKVVGKDYGIASVNGVDVAPFRVESEHDGRHAKVRFDATLTEDLARRDFTVNAMAIGLDGKLIDPFGGLNDAKAGVLRFVNDPDKRLTEDFTRGLRALRLSAKLSMLMHDSTKGAIRRHAERIAAEPPERIMKELRKAGTGFSGMVQSMFGTGLGCHLLPEVEALKGVEQNRAFHPEGDAFVHTLLVVESLPETASLELRIAALLHDIGKAVTTEIHDDGRITSHGHDKVGAEMAGALLKRLKASTEADTDTVEFLVRSHMLLHHESTTKRPLRRILAERGPKALEMLVELAKADLPGKNANEANRKNFELVDEVLRETEETKAARTEPVLTGAEIMKLLGLNPGPEIGRLKEALKDHQFGADHALTREEAVLFLSEAVRK